MIDGAFQRVEVPDETVTFRSGRQTLRVQARRGERRSKPMGEVGGELALFLEEVTNPRGQLVESGADIDELLRARRLDPGFEVSRAEAGCSAGELLDGLDQRPSQPIGGYHSDEHQRHTERGKNDPGAGDVAPQLR